MKYCSFKILLISLLVATSLFSCKPNRKVIAVATFVDHVTLDVIRDSFKEELINLGYSKENGWDIIIKSANGLQDEAVLVAKELLNKNPQVVVSISTPATKPVFDFNQGKIPHVFSFVSFPEVIGIEKNSKNTAGLSDGVDFEGSFELIKSLLPRFSSLGMVYSDEPNAIHSKNQMQDLCQKNGVRFIGQMVARQDEVKQACQIIANRNVDAIIIGADGIVVPQIIAMVEVANARKIPLFTMDEATVEAGAFAALSVNYVEFGKETARLTDIVIKNGKALPENQKVYLGKEAVFNLKTASIIGLEIPQSIINNAYKTFE